MSVLYYPYIWMNLAMSTALYFTVRRLVPDFGRSNPLRLSTDDNFLELSPT